MNSVCRLLAGSFLAGMASATIAASSASASLASVKLTLVDLDPSDGVAPWITFLDSSETFRGVVSVSSKDQVIDSAFPRYTTAFTSFSLQASSAGLTASASFASDATAIGGTHLAQSTAPFGVYRQQAVAQALGAWNSFKISDKTLLVVTATSTLSAEVTHAWSGPSALDVEMADAVNRIQLWGAAAGGDGTGTQSSDAFQEIMLRSQASWNAATAQFDFAPVASSQSTAFSASFVNLSGAEMTGTLAMYSSVISATPGTPVPEPVSAWLLLVGLLGVGAALRNRR